MPPVRMQPTPPLSLIGTSAPTCGDIWSVGASREEEPGEETEATLIGGTVVPLGRLGGGGGCGRRLAISSSMNKKTITNYLHSRVVQMDFDENRPFHRLRTVG